MTAFEEVLVKATKNAMQDIVKEAAAYSDAAGGLLNGEDPAWDKMWLDLEQRIAITIVQSRALECRHLAGELLINGANNSIAKQVAARLIDRSHKLEQIGMMLAKQWPPLDGNEVMVCRCAIDHGEVKEGDVFVCAHCKLPKTAAAAKQQAGPRLVI